MNRIRFLFLDVDGTLTDGRIYMSDKGEFFKAFDVKDGCGIKDILPDLGITPVVITARTSQILKNRCKELGIKHCYQGIRDKIAKIAEIMDEYDIKPNSDGIYIGTAYMGDDILDIPPMSVCQIKACPNDAYEKVKEVADYICQNPGGHGAVREFIDYILSL